MKTFEKIVKLDNEKRVILDKLMELTTELDKCLWKQIQYSLSFRKWISEEMDSKDNSELLTKFDKSNIIFCKNNFHKFTENVVNNSTKHSDILNIIKSMKSGCLKIKSCKKQIDKLLQSYKR